MFVFLFFFLSHFNVSRVTFDDDNHDDGVIMCANLKRPFLLQGHERPITVVKYNYDGDLLFSASKDQVPSVWRSENGERLGTFNGHKGTIWDLDCDRFSKQLVTASADA
jgi:WD40 repeat protein